jgi:CRISPR system Cascade subunit CasA
MSEFNLIDEPWIRVAKGTKICTVGLHELFENAHEYDGLAGELPTQDFAVLRLLLAIMYASLYKDIQNEDDAICLWESLYNSGQFDINVIGSYLEKYRERFYLFDDKYPFYQVPGINAPIVSMKKFNGEIFESEHKTRIFSTYAGESKEILTYAEAARWLVHFISYDDAAAKQSDESKKIIGTVSTGVGWLGQIGGIFVSGKNLFETLLLNFCVLNRNSEPWDLSNASWELEKDDFERRKIITPKDPLKLFTLQSRRILLFHENEKVISYKAYGGDFFSSENAFCEMMTAWINVAKKNEPAKLIPKTHDESRMMWQSMDNFFIDTDKAKCAGLVDHLCMIDRINPNILNNVLFHAVGISYKKPMSSSAEFIYSDMLTFNISLITELGVFWRERIIDELKTTAFHVYSYCDFASSLYLAIGGDNGKGQTSISSSLKAVYTYDSDGKNAFINAVRANAYALLDIPFREWLASVSVDDDIDEKSLIWQDASKRIILKAGRDLIGKLNLQLCKPRGGTEGNKTVNIYKALNEFERRIKYKGVKKENG